MYTNYGVVLSCVLKLINGKVDINCFIYILMEKNCYNEIVKDIAKIKMSSDFENL